MGSGSVYFHTITSILKPVVAEKVMDPSKVFPYDYVYFKANLAFLTNIGGSVFPYDYVYFKAMYWKLADELTKAFPYDYVYFKAQRVLLQQTVA